MGRTPESEMPESLDTPIYRQILEEQETGVLPPEESKWRRRLDRFARVFVLGGSAGTSLFLAACASPPAVVEVREAEQEAPPTQVPTLTFEPTPPATFTPEPTSTPEPTVTPKPIETLTPTETPTPTSTLTETPTPTPVCGELALAEGKKAVNIRKGPGTNYGIVETLNPGEKVFVRAKTGNGWVFGDLIGPDERVVREGIWITASPELVTISCGLDEIPIVPPEKIPPTPTPVSSSEVPSAPQIEKNLQRWLNGELRVEQSELLFENFGGLIIPLGTLKPIDLNRDESVHYQGVLLGQRVIDGQLIVLMGFEDRWGKRYTFPFNAGPLKNGLLVQVNQASRFYELYFPLSWGFEPFWAILRSDDLLHAVA
ncbi:MAG: SH3 domain-containing protein [Anaerolineae bacterium]|nr:SH3 domain-containing protein [Anaerolineae bacterium]